MSTKIFPGKLTKIEVGASGASHVDLTNLKSIAWRRSHAIKPRTTANTKIPVGWHQPHSWIEGELRLLSEGKAAFYDQAQAYIDDDGDNVIIPYFVVTAKREDGGDTTFAFNNAIISFVDQDIGDYEEVVFVYHFLAYYKTRSDA